MSIKKTKDSFVKTSEFYQDDIRLKLIGMLVERQSVCDELIAAIEKNDPIEEGLDGLAILSKGCNGDGSQFYALMAEYCRRSQAMAADDSNFVPNAEEIE